jgi:hypothetical protein
MTYIIISSFLITAFYIPYGAFLLNEEKVSFKNFSAQILYALIILSFIGLIVNFLFPLSIELNSILIIVSLFLFIKDRKRYFNQKFFLFSFLIGLILLLLMLNSNTFRPDSGLYHFPYIKILNDEKIILGLSNIHFRFAHISIIQYVSAISNNFLFLTNGMLFPTAIIFAAVIINFSSEIYDYVKNRNFNLRFFYLFFTLIFIFYKMNRYSEYGNDIPSHLLFFFLISELLNFKKYTYNIKKICNLFIFSSFIFLNKITLGIACILPFCFINKKNFFNLFKIKRTYFGMLFLILWFFKNILVSGCLIYPISNTCLTKLSWTDIEEVKEISNQNEAWAKSFPDQKKILSYEKFNSEFNWIKSWIKNYLMQLINIFYPYIVFILILFAYIKKRERIKVLDNSSKSILFQIILFIGCLVWFLKLPLYRYGASLLISFITLFFAHIFYQYAETSKTPLKTYIAIIIVGFIVFITKNSIRIFNNNYYYNNYPWPKYYSHDDKNILPEIKSININNKIIYRAKYGICMYSPSPCAGYIKNFNINQKWGYLILDIN